MRSRKPLQNHRQRQEGARRAVLCNHCDETITDVACMARRTWTTTKRRDRLQERLWLYLAWNNGYPWIDAIFHFHEKKDKRESCRY